MVLRGQPWPSRSSDQTSPIYYPWKHIKSVVYIEISKNKEELDGKIITAATLTRAFRNKLQKVTSSV